MGGYRTILVGTDGSASSMRAVAHAGAFAAQEGAKLIIATAHTPSAEGSGLRAPAHDYASDPRAADALGAGEYKLHGEAPTYEILRDAAERAKAAGARDVVERAVTGAPVHALVKLAKEVNADLLVVGDVGLNTTAGRLIGSVPSEVARKAKVDILIVHTAD